jgi:hypothetical protein
LAFFVFAGPDPIFQYLQGHLQSLTLRYHLVLEPDHLHFPLLRLPRYFFQDLQSIVTGGSGSFSRTFTLMLCTSFAGSYFFVFGIPLRRDPTFNGRFDGSTHSFN